MVAIGAKGFHQTSIGWSRERGYGEAHLKYGEQRDNPAGLEGNRWSMRISL